jgi:hypothetical protein
MAEQTVTQQIVREAPEIEAYKLKLQEEARNWPSIRAGDKHSHSSFLAIR